MKLAAVFCAMGLGLLCANGYADDQTMQPTTVQDQAVATNNLQAGIAFLNRNKFQTGVVTLPDGLQYKILVAGNGAKPTDTDSVTVNYAGQLCGMRTHIE